MGEGPIIAFQGRRDGRSAFGLINAQWSRALTRAGYPVTDYAAGGSVPSVLIHHDFESQFSRFAPPHGAKCVAVRTWDFGPFPPVWVEKINREFHQYWANSNWIATLARRSGVREDLVRLVPLGFDPDVFSPDGHRYPLPTEKGFRFLFVGGVSRRKGSDILLGAYQQAFTSSDDVCLVLKDHSGDLFYRDDAVRERIGQLREDPAAPEIVHLDAFLPDRDLAALYRSCDVAVFPYRAEGFCIPILEAMACGTPSIVPEFGACLDFCDSKTSHLVKARRIHAPVTRSFRVALGFEEEISEVDFCEVRKESLVEALRNAVGEAPEVWRLKADAGVARAHGKWTWEHATAVMMGQLQELLG